MLTINKGKLVAKAVGTFGLVFWIYLLAPPIGAGLSIGVWRAMALE